MRAGWSTPWSTASACLSSNFPRRCPPSECSSYRASPTSSYPSGSGQAYVTMPIMAPLADIVGVSRQVAVLAFQFGDGFSNISDSNAIRACRNSCDGWSSVRPMVAIHLALYGEDVRRGFDRTGRSRIDRLLLRRERDGLHGQAGSGDGQQPGYRFLPLQKPLSMLVRVSPSTAGQSNL